MTTAARIVSYALCAFCAACLAACQTVINDPVALPHDEQIVVEAFIEAGKPVEKMIIEQTVGALDTLTPSLAFVGDADVTVKVDGRSYKGALKLDSSAYILFYGQKTLRSVYAVPGLVAESGKTYELSVSRGGKTAWAQTRVPAAPALAEPLSTRQGADTTRGRRSTTVRKTLRAQTSINANPDENYEIWLYALPPKATGNETVFYNSAFAARNSAQIFRLPPGSQPGKLLASSLFTLYSYSLSAGAPPNPFAGARLYAVVQAYDKPYYDYFTTLSRARNSGDNALSNAGLNPLWNVTGNGIGVFIGVSRREIPVALP